MYLLMLIKWKERILASLNVLNYQLKLTKRLLLSSTHVNNASYMMMFLKAFEVLPVNISKAFYIGVLSEKLEQREPKRYLFMKETTRKIIKLLLELDREREKSTLYSWFYCLFLIYSIS